MANKRQHYHVALSYKSKHKTYAAEVEKCLFEEGYDVYNYEGNAHKSTTRDSLSVDLIEKFKNADLCVLMVDEGYTKSQHCQEESATAHARLSKENDCLILGIFGQPSMPKGAKPDAEYVKLDDLLPTTFAREYILAALRDKSVFPSRNPLPTRQEKKHGLFFGIPGYRMAYIPSPMGRTWHEYHRYNFSQLEVTAKQEKFKLHKPYCEWDLMRKPKDNLLGCRLESSTQDSGAIQLQIQPTFYEDYLRTGERIDFTTTDKGDETYLERFLNELSPYRGKLTPFEELTNICGVGLFTITADKQIMVSTHSNTSQVYPGRLTFSASGIMLWGACPNPFTAVVSKAQEEVGHQVDFSKLELMAVGCDARKLYFQFSFVEDASKFSAGQIKDHYETWKAYYRNPPRDLHDLALDVDVICNSLVENCWEPAAEAAILTLLTKKKGRDKVRSALERRRGMWWKRRMRDEWDHRASRPGVLADMSLRYDRNELERVSNRYVEYVTKFIRSHIKGKSVVEVGSGTGRITKAILSLGPQTVTCIELSPLMEARHKKAFAGQNFSIEYKPGFAQDVLPTSPTYDIAICSLVLIHNVGDTELKALIDRLAQSAGHVFLFEDVRERQPSPATRILPQSELCDRLKPYFNIKRKKIFELSGDLILSLHLNSKRCV